MTKKTKEDEQLIKEKLKYIGLNLENIPTNIFNSDKVKYRPLKNYDDTNYKVYKFIDIKDIDILITPLDRLDDLNEKYKNAEPILEYLQQNSEENIEKYTIFLNMLKITDIDKIEEIEAEQKKLNKKIPFQIKYKNNFMWQIYYSDIEDKYFMLFSCNESNTECLFYLIKKKIQALKSKKKEMIYVPISHIDHSNKLLKKSEIADLENYLWFFTKEWPAIYEVYNQKDEISLQIVGETEVYEKINSIYKIVLNEKNEAEKAFKLIKALFILQSNNENEYQFKPIINEIGGLDFCYNLNKITYNNLPQFIKQQVQIKNEKISSIHNQTIIKMETMELLKQTVKKQNEEYLTKEKQIVNFLECKKTFFGRVKFFFKGNKKKNIKRIELPEEPTEKETIAELKKIEKKDLYTIEDLLKISNLLKEEEIKLKNLEMDIKALENKKENLENKIKNATLYINEIESHKKSIFVFWKFTNKDEVSLLTESEQKEEIKTNKIKKVFNYEEDLEELGKKIDTNQRNILSKNECDAIFAIKNDLESFNILGKQKVLKRDTQLIEKRLKELQKEYLENYENIKAKDFDIFGNVVEDKTKIKILKNNKHREIEKDKYKILSVNPQTTIEEYKDNIENYKILLNEAYGKITSPCDISIYMVGDQEVNMQGFQILNINPKEELKSYKTKEEKVILYRLNLKEKMPAIFYTNIMFYDNTNQTLPVGMDITTQVLININDFDTKLISRKNFNINYEENEFENSVKLVEVYEYNMEVKIK